jgi:hypothetical protein
VAAGKHRGENPVHYVFLSDDPLRHLALQPSDGTDQAFQLLDIVVRGRLGGGHG